MMRALLLYTGAVLLAAVASAVAISALDAPRDNKIALTVPKPLPECWKLDMEAAEYRFAAASARLNGYYAEAEMWYALAEETEGRWCSGERWEIGG
jgi:ABC-type xylose transport system substrate-binding protein